MNTRVAEGGEAGGNFPFCSFKKGEYMYADKEAFGWICPTIIETETK